jgi:16S rRNA (uracil1498-N3)-methyltransferase
VIPAEAINITLAQSLPKAKKMDSIIEKACELGAFKIIPFVSARSIPRLPPEKALLKQARWQKIALEAARKCRLNWIPEVGNIHTFEKMLRSAGENDIKIIFWEEETGKNLKQTLQERQSEASRDFFLVVGPEGGFAEDEIWLAESMGFTSVSLGRQILKVETAVLAILSIIQYEKGAFSVTK